MFFQLLFAEHIAGLPSLQFDVLVLTALALFNYSTGHQDTVWECPIVSVTATFQH
jgi:hypothetical protein